MTITRQQAWEMHRDGTIPLTDEDADVYLAVYQDIVETHYTVITWWAIILDRHSRDDHYAIASTIRSIVPPEYQDAVADMLDNRDPIPTVIRICEPKDK